jgi:triosephosphate isomerase (TIM)
MKKLIVGNWKMNPQTAKEAETLLKNIGKEISTIKNAEIVICAPFPFIPLFKKLKIKKIVPGAQDVFYEQNGAFTGEISPSMLRDMGVSYVIVGHSERRAMGDTNEIVNKKLIAVLKAKMTPLLCIGEDVRHNDASYLTIVKNQLIACLKDVQKQNLKNIVIAYEPVWALSSTINRHDATPHDFEEMRIYIRKILTDLYSSKTAASVRILYGGSVNKDNAEGFLNVGAAGLLPGKTSLMPQNFGAIIHNANNLK